MGVRRYDKNSYSKKMRREEIIVDTNALLIPGKFGLDIFEELARLGYRHVIVPKMVVNELKKLKEREGESGGEGEGPRLTGKEKMAVNVGYSLLQKYVDTTISEQKRVSGYRFRCTVTIEEGEKKGENGERMTDELIIALAAERKAAVLTNDRRLRTKLSEAGIVTVYLRGRNRLDERA